MIVSRVLGSYVYGRRSMSGMYNLFSEMQPVLLSVDSKLAFGSYTLAFGTEWT